MTTYITRNKEVHHSYVLCLILIKRYLLINGKQKLINISCCYHIVHPCVSSNQDWLQGTSKRRLYLIYYGDGSLYKVNRICSHSEEDLKTGARSLCVNILRSNKGFSSLPGSTDIWRHNGRNSVIVKTMMRFVTSNVNNIYHG